jgi:alpha-L-rhamnosidase
MMRQAWLATLLTALGASAAQGATTLQVEDLRCEYLRDPLGIDEPRPRLSWTLRSDQRAQRQTAYQILVASSPELLEGQQGDLWDSNRVASAETAQVVYAGKPLPSRQGCYWKVRVWDGNNELSDWSPSARWEMGLLRPDDWSARWIGADLKVEPAVAAESLAGARWIWFPEPGADLTKKAPAGTRYFRRHIVLPPGAKAEYAWLTLSVDRCYTLFVNGQRVAQVDGQFSWSAPRQYDLRALLSAGDNVLAVEATSKRSVAGLCAKLSLRAAGQEPEVVVSDRQWKVAAGKVEGWTTVGFDDSQWKAAAEICLMGEEPWGDDANRAPSQSPILRKVVTLADRPIAKARLYATALGLYELRINGRRVGDHLLAPDWTDYDKRVRYQVYDVGGLLRPGLNALAALLGNGRYCGHMGFGRFQQWGKTPALLAQLEVTYRDGSTQHIVTDGSWRVHESPIDGSDLMVGESYDARRELPGWDQPGTDDSAWPAAAPRKPPLGTLDGQAMEPVRALAEIQPKTIRALAPGRWIFDLGQNLVGVVRLKVAAPASTRLVLRHAEMLNPDGTLYTDNLRSALATDSYVCRGGGLEVWQPRFTVHGFRYVELAGLPGKPNEETVTGIVLGSDTPRTGRFECSDARINQLQANIQWGQRGNYLGVPTDCPQRDERMGWMGDAQVFVRTAAWNADVAAFFSKWLVDVDDAQVAGGAFTNVSPSPEHGRGTPAWADAGVICPWTIYQVYGDRRILERHLPAMTRWIEWCRGHSTDLVRDTDRGNDYGDWLSIAADTPKDVIGTAYFAYSTRLVAKSYQALGRSDEAAKYEQLFQDIKAAFNKRYVGAESRIEGDTQCCYAMALRFDLLPEELRPKAAQRLEDDIKAKGWHLSTGFVGVSHLLPVLTRAGKLDTAYRLLMQDTFPSWLFSVNHGATTIWERWDGWTPERGFQDPNMNSFNHYSLGSCGQWLFDTVAGIGQDPDRPGFRHVLIHPRPGGGLTWAKASFRSIRGRIASEWKLGADGSFALSVTIPAGTTATVTLPASQRRALTESGKPLEDAVGVRLLRREASCAVLEIGSGSYYFLAR